MSNSNSKPPAAFGKRLVLVLGPPGCGKTTRLLSKLRKAIVAGILVAQIALVSFTRAARREFMERISREFQVKAEDLTWFRTIHSMAFHLLGAKREQMMGSRDWEAFAFENGYNLSRVADPGIDLNPFEPPRQTRDDELRFALEWCRSRLLSLDVGLASCPVTVSVSDAQAFQRRLNEYKRKHMRRDFADLLEECLDRGLRPPVKVAFIDEAQDLSPAQIAAVEAWFGPCEVVVVAGDDDQAVYTWAGADPGWILRLNGVAQKVEILDQSYRIPATVHSLAERIIGQNQHRVPKVYKPRAEPGKISRMFRDEAIDAVCASTGSVFVLARNRMFLKGWEEQLLARGVAFIAEGTRGTSPLGDAKLRNAVNAAAKLAGGNDLTIHELKALLDRIPSKGAITVSQGIKGKATRLANRGSSGMFSRKTLADEWKLGDMLAKIDELGPVRVFVKMEEWLQIFIERLLAAHGQIPEPRVVLTTLHGSKGREADMVVVMPDMTTSTYLEFVGSPEGRESETRVFYVGATRTRQHLILVEPTETRFYDFAPLLPEGEVERPKDAITRSMIEEIL